MYIFFVIMVISCFIGMLVLINHLSKYMPFRESWILWAFTIFFFGRLFYDMCTFDSSASFQKSSPDADVSHNKS